jgi:hypothetical protein
MSKWTIRRVEDGRVIGTVTSFTTANEICRCLTERGIVAEARNFDEDDQPRQPQQTQEEDSHD